MSDVVDAVLSQHVELRQVNGVNALAQDQPLASFLAACFEEFLGVLKVVAVDDSSECLPGIERHAVAREDVTEATLFDRDERQLVDAILPAPIADVHATAQDVGLISGSAVGGDELPLVEGSAGGPKLFDDPDGVVGNMTDRAICKHERNRRSTEQRSNDQPQSDGEVHRASSHEMTLRRLCRGYHQT